MTTRRKTWMGVGLVALAGTTLPAASPPTAHAAGILSIGQPDQPALAADATSRHIILAQALQGGEGGEAGDVPDSYALTTDDPAAYTYDAEDEIAAYVRGVRSTYAAATDQVRELADAVGSLLADPTDATMAAAREAWVAARPAYLLTEAYRFYDGPIEAIEGEINSWPINEAFIDYVEGKPDAGMINATDKDISIVNLLLANQVTDETDVTLGWHAVEFLLWGQDMDANGPGARPVSDYVPGSTANDRRRAYLRIATDRLVADIGRLVSAWDAESEASYAAKFLKIDKREAIGRIVNGMAVLAGEELMSERMAVGLDSGDQEDEHSCFSDTTHQDFVYDLKGIANIWTGEYLGAPGPGIRGLVTRVDPTVAAEVDGLLADATAKIAALGDPWDQVLASPEGSPARVQAEAAVTALGDLAKGLKKAGAALGVVVQIPG